MSHVILPISKIGQIFLGTKDLQNKREKRKKKQKALFNLILFN